MLREDVRPEDARILRHARFIPAGPDRAAGSERRSRPSASSAQPTDTSSRSDGSCSGARAFLHLLGSHFVSRLFVSLVNAGSDPSACPPPARVVPPDDRRSPLSLCGSGSLDSRRPSVDVLFSALGFNGCGHRRPCFPGKAVRNFSLPAQISLAQVLAPKRKHFLPTGCLLYATIFTSFN